MDSYELITDYLRDCSRCMFAANDLIKDITNLSHIKFGYGEIDHLERWDKDGSIRRDCISSIKTLSSKLDESKNIFSFHSRISGYTNEKS